MVVSQIFQPGGFDPSELYPKRTTSGSGSTSKKTGDIFGFSMDMMPHSELLSAFGLFLPKLTRQKVVLDEALVPKNSAIRKAIEGEEPPKK